MLTPWVEALESLVNFCMLFPDMAIDINSIPAITQNVILPLPSLPLLSTSTPSPSEAGKDAANVKMDPGVRRDDGAGMTPGSGGDVRHTERSTGVCI